MGDLYVLGFADAPRCLQTQILCRPYKSPSDEEDPGKKKGMVYAGERRNVAEVRK